MFPNQSDFVITYEKALRERLAFEAHDQVARRYAMTTQWSTWHTWDKLRTNDPLLQKANVEDIIWHELAPYATCVGLSFPVASDIRSTLRKANGILPCLVFKLMKLMNLGLDVFASKVEVLATWEPDSDGIDRPFHCLVVSRMERFCIVVDLVFSSVAFIVPLEGSYTTMPYITTSGRQGQRTFRYKVAKSGERELTIERSGLHGGSHVFWPINHSTALKQISLHAASRSEPGTGLPAKKCVVVKSVVRYKPNNISAEALDAGSWIITSCRLQVDFANKRLSLQIPLADWLLQPQG
jgi:hypothetical protein